MNTRTWLLLATLGSAAGFPAHADDLLVHPTLSDARLDTIRGGFDFGENLRASFALQRTVLINGVEAMQTHISVPDIANITSAQASALQSALRTTVVTNGAGGVTTDALAPAASAVTSAGALTSSPATGLIIQNSLDNQAISATTTIDASVNTARTLQDMRVAESIQDAVIQFRGN